MRTTIVLNDELFRAAKQRAASEGTTLRAVVEGALRSHLNARPRRPRYRLRWRPVRGRLLPGVDLADRKSLYEVMEGRE